MSDLDYPNILLWAIPFFIVGIGLELWRLKIKPVENAYTVKDAVTSLIMGSGMSASDMLLKGITLGFLLWVWQFRVFDLGTGVLIVVLALFLDDFFYYWKHYLYHKVRWLWAVHIVHHSSEHYNLTTALRQPWTNTISGAVLLKVPMVLMGFHPLLLAFVGGLNLLYQFWIHTETINKCPKWFEYIFNTPSHHRVHHGRNPRYLDSNFGGILIIWDRLFGSFVPELNTEKPDYGIVTPLRSYNPIVVAFAEYGSLAKDVCAKGLSLWQRLMLIFAPPGTSYDGSKKTVKGLKTDYIKEHPGQDGTPGFKNI